MSLNPEGPSAHKHIIIRAVCIIHEVLEYKKIPVYLHLRKRSDAEWKIHTRLKYTAATMELQSVNFKVLSTLLTLNLIIYYM